MSRQPSPRYRPYAAPRSLPVTAECETADLPSQPSSSLGLVLSGVGLRLSDERAAGVLAIAGRPGARLVVRVAGAECRVRVGGSLVRRLRVGPMRPASLVGDDPEDGGDA